VREIAVVCDRLPEVPVMVTLTVPVVAVLLAVSVKVLLALAGFGLNDAVTPLGKPEADRLTLPVKPFCGVTVTVLVPLAPCVTVTLLGDAERPKFGRTVTARAIVVIWDKLPDVPVMVTVTVPVVAVLLAVSVKVLLAVAGFGLKDAVTPLGKPDADKLTLPLKPLSGVAVTALVPLVPCVTVKLLGDAERVKSPTGFTVTVIVASLLKLPDVPVTVTGKVPIAAVPVADRVKRLVVVAGFVPKAALTPLGRPEAVKFTLPRNPFSGLIVMVVDPADPWTKVKVVDAVESVKLGFDEADQLFTKLAALTVPMPVAKSQPTVVP
jgi:hypothetical protein